MRDPLRTVISQYQASATMRQMVLNINDWIDPRQNIDAFYTKIWNLDTATGYGLDVWGRIVGVGRVLKLTGAKYFGFEQQLPDVDTFGPLGAGPWYSGEALTDNFVLSDPGFRTLILAKAAANICDGSIRAINSILMMLFGTSGDVYCTDGGDMTMTYTFTFPPTSIQTAIVENSGVLPRPAGVSATLVVV